MRPATAESDNAQPIEKRSRSEGTILDIHSVFYTIQGEGPFCGTPAVFIRLAGCNLQCPRCDTDYTSNRTPYSPAMLLKAVGDLYQHGHRGPKLVVITGGEPFRQDLTLLLMVLTANGYYVQVESNGTLEPTPFKWNTDTSQRLGAYIVVSPKTGKVHELAARESCCFKYVLEAHDEGDDGLPNRALRHTANPRLARPPADYRRPIYLQPMDDQDPVRNHKNIQAAVRSCMKHGYTLQLQIHKLIGVE